jgi:hypothetical protein
MAIRYLPVKTCDIPFPVVDINFRAIINITGILFYAACCGVHLFDRAKIVICNDHFSPCRAVVKIK